MLETITQDSTIGTLAAELPGAARVFEELGIDYCCGGKKPLSQACSTRGIAIDHVLDRLRNAPVGPDECDWSAATMTQLADHIETTHHAYLKIELPRLQGLLNKVVRAHGQRHPEMQAVQEIYQTLATDMASHMDKEEQVLFPLLRRSEQLHSKSPIPIDRPINCLVHEHNEAGSLMGQLRSLTNDFTPPADACTTFRVLLKDMAAMEKDLHQHVHKENNILFSKALQNLA